MINVFFEIINLLAQTVISLGGYIVFAILFVYNIVDSIKETIVAAGLGVPTIVLTIVGAISLIAKVLFKIVDPFV